MENQYCYNYPRPAYTVDAAIIYNNYLLLIQRRNEPYKGMWALPGGFMDMNETPEEAAKRELEEETGLICKNLIQFRTYGSIHRDPRHRTISTVYYHKMETEILPIVNSGDDAINARWFPINNLPLLAFDHQKIVQDLINTI